MTLTACIRSDGGGLRLARCARDGDGGHRQEEGTAARSAASRQAGQEGVGQAGLVEAADRGPGTAQHGGEAQTGVAGESQRARPQRRTAAGRDGRDAARTCVRYGWTFRCALH